MSQQQPKAPSRKPTIPVGERVVAIGWGPAEVVAVRTRKKYARRYLCTLWRASPRWFRQDELAVPS